MKTFKRKVFNPNSITKLQINATDYWVALALKKPTYTDIVKIAGNFEDIKKLYRTGLIVGIRRLIVVLDNILGSEVCIELACQATKELVTKGAEVLRIFTTEDLYGKHDLQTTMLVNIIVAKMMPVVKPNTKPDSIPGYVDRSLLVLELPEQYRKYISGLVADRLSKRNIALTMYPFEESFCEK
jgi:hypothetical protein